MATTALARRYGTEPTRPIVGDAPAPRSLEAIAVENAREGCVRETYGALVALWQARHAGDPVVATAMAPIANDEVRHAELAWEVGRWAELRLSPTARQRVASAREQAMAALRTESLGPVDRSLVAWAGVPSAKSAASLLWELERIGSIS